MKSIAAGALMVPMIFDEMPARRWTNSQNAGSRRCSAGWICRCSAGQQCVAQGLPTRR
jgi:hypothetical protein